GRVPLRKFRVRNSVLSFGASFRGASQTRTRNLEVPGSTLRVAPERRRGCLSPGQIEDALGDDAEHHLARAAFDRVGLGAQPGARAGAAPRALAFPFQRIDA